jgi:hypothetical protein
MLTPPKVSQAVGKGHWKIASHIGRRLNSLSFKEIKKNSLKELSIHFSRSTRNNFCVSSAAVVAQAAAVGPWSSCVKSYRWDLVY